VAGLAGGFHRTKAGERRTDHDQAAAGHVASFPGCAATSSVSTPIGPVTVAPPGAPRGVVAPGQGQGEEPRVVREVVLLLLGHLFGPA